MAEVILRGEKECLDKLTRQLPLHQEAVSKNADELVARVFGSRHAGKVERFGSILILQGYVGSPRMRGQPFAFCDERLLLKRLAGGGSLASLFDWCREMPYLPINGRDFVVAEEDVTTTSGVRIVYHESAYSWTAPRRAS